MFLGVTGGVGWIVGDGGFPVGGLTLGGLAGGVTTGVCGTEGLTTGGFDFGKLLGLLANTRLQNSMKILTAFSPDGSAHD